MRGARVITGAALVLSVTGGLPLASPAFADTSIQPNLSVTLIQPGYEVPDRPLRVSASTWGDVESTYPVVTNTIDFGDGTVTVVAANSTSYPHDYAAPGTYTVTHVITDDHGRTGTTSRDISVGSGYIPLYYPTRFLDTRIGFGAPTRAVGPEGVLKLQVTGVSGVPTDRKVTAVLLNLTATNATDATHLTAFPGGAVPTVSNVNVTPGHDVANAVLVPVAPDGTISLFNHAGSVDLVVDILGYFTPEPRSWALRLGTAQNIVRALDTRNGTGGLARKIGPNEAITVPVRGPGMLPEEAAIAVVNLTATEGTESSFVTATPNMSPPHTSNLNFAAGQTVANQVTAPINPDGTITLYNHVGNVHLIADIQGYYSSSLQDASGKAVLTTGPTRLVDTRIAGQALGAGGRLKVKVRGTTGVPDGVSAVLVNLTATNPTQVSWLKVFTPGRSWTDASNLNVTPGATVPDSALVPVDSDGYIEVYNNAGSTDVIVDLQGFIV
ncbi:PKD domain-containing protein [Kitasatospora sp. NBC_00240]|uniref:PKD domain-containing protein n=1 Tax=Kitasatospora sp. NBC_00240 TaxID=2903567 RepID=UPI00224F15E1|nr:PKD domain-containing protein [Kitasatospora sp. NBC_00240]MCX5212161.1 PKD domain-containing protein [Kitasatospora sp. NBC_00240]